VRRYLKKAAPRDRGDTAALESAVREMLAEIKQNRDDAIRRYAEKLDHWTKPEFRVSADEIRQASARLPESFKEDFKYAYKQVTGFARHQRDSLRDFEVEIEPGIWLGQKSIPVAKVGCYIPGGKYPLIAAAIMSTSARLSRHLSAAALCAAHCRCGRDFRFGRRTGLGRHGIRMRWNARSRYDNRAWKSVCG
jgi:histidinol dehydrogenase